MATKVFGITIGKEKPPVNPADAPVPEVTFVPSLPSVNALPVKIKEQYRNRALINKFISGAVGLAVIIGALFGYSAFGEMQHSAAMTKYDDEAAALNSQIAALQPYENYKVQVGGKLTTLAEYLAKDVDAAKIVRVLFEYAATYNISFTEVSLSIVGDDGKNSCPSPDPFNTIETIGCVSFQGHMPDAAGLNGFIDSITNTSGFVNVFLRNATYGSSYSNNNFSGSFAFTSELYSNRFSNYVLPIEILIQNGLDAKTEEPTTVEDSNSSDSTTEPEEPTTQTGEQSSTETDTSSGGTS